MEKRVFATSRFEAVHAWPGCDIDEVDYLRNRHRHVFHVKAEKDVNHNDRDTEFIWLKHRVEEETASWGRELGPTSVEMMAERLIGRLGLVACEVLEDGENGVRIELQSPEELAEIQANLTDEFPVKD